MRLKISCILLLMLAGCATTPGEDRLAERDPLEGFNRGVWGFNRALDTVALKPATSVYRTITPRPARRGLSRIFSNLSEPFSMINNILQGKPDRAMRNLERFAINTTIGVGGLADHATDFGVAPAPEDFGQTLASWGANGGPYLVLPLLGPSTLRDGVGSGVAQLADPYRIGLRNSGLSGTAQLGVNAGEIISTRSELTESGADTFLDTSLDPYAAARSAYLQRRYSEIRNEEDGGGGADQEAPADDAVPPEAVSKAPEAAPTAK
jgi:phospholipid-binding lipoprotein MlaA